MGAETPKRPRKLRKKDAIDARKRGLESLTLTWRRETGGEETGVWVWHVPVAVEITELLTMLAEIGALPCCHTGRVVEAKAETFAPLSSLEPIGKCVKH